MYIYQIMDEFNIPIGIPLFSTPPTFIKPGEVMTSNMAFPNEKKNELKYDNIKPELLDKYKSILAMPDEDEVNGKIEAKARAAELREKLRQEKERLRLEEMRVKNEDSKLGKYKKKCNELTKLLLKSGFNEEDCKRLCGSCKYPAPYHNEFREIDKTTPTGFSLNCKKCEKNGKARQFNLITGEEITEGAAAQKSKIHHMTHAFNNKCKCGKILTISDIAGLEDTHYKRHLKTAYHRQWEMIYNHQLSTSSTNIHIIFELFSVKQLRTIIKNNKTNGKPLIDKYSNKNKEEIIEVLKKVKTRLNIDYSILPDPHNKDKKIGNVYEELQEDYDETLHYSTDEDKEDSEDD